MTVLEPAWVKEKGAKCNKTTRWLLDDLFLMETCRVTVDHIVTGVGYGSGGVREKPINTDINTVRFHIDGLKLTM